MSNIKGYLSVIKGEFLVSISYAAYSYASIIASLTQIMIFYFLWRTVYVGKAVLNGYTYSEIILYIILGRIIVSMFNWGVNQYISELIRNGLIGIKLLYPTNFILNLYCAGIGNNLITNILFTAIPTFVFSILLLDIQFSVTFLNFILFFFSIFLGFTVMFFFDFFLGILNFWTENGWAMQTIKTSLFKFFSGSLVPISFFPPFLKIIANVMPFKVVVDGPINILLGKYTFLGAFQYLGFQILWIIVLGIIDKLFFEYAVKKVTIYGG